MHHCIQTYIHASILLTSHICPCTVPTIPRYVVCISTSRLEFPVADLGPLAKRHTRGIHIPNESQTRNDVSRSMQVEKKENRGIACAVHVHTRYLHTYKLHVGSRQAHCAAILEHIR